MTDEQKEKIKDVIRKDATGRRMLVRTHSMALRLKKPEYCVMGGLAHEIGVTHRQMHGKAELGFTRGAWAAVEKAYGLTPGFANWLVRVNDHYWALNPRREALIALVDAFGS